MKKLLEVKDLSVNFAIYKKQLKAVREISFDVREGEILGIVGESGSGKSAASKALIKLLPSYSSTLSGEVWFEGQNLMGFSDKEMQKVRGKEIGMIFQDPMTSLNPTLKIGRQIVEGYLRHHPEVSKARAKEYAIEMLELVGISEPEQRADSYPHTLSGGMRQRVMIALALAANPKLLIADEPTTSLDVTIQAQILDLMKNIRKKMNTSIILITHDLSVVAGYCDRILVMYAGKIIECAEVHELFENPKHPYTQRLLQSLPRLDRPKDHPLTSLEGMPPNLMNPLAGCSFAARCPVKMEQCEQKSPALYPVGKTHQCACLQYESAKEAEHVL